MIEHKNIFYVKDIHEIGGVETFVYELAKKYKDYDIAVVCKNIALEQKKRLKKFCKVYVHKDEPIKCKVIVTNYDTSILNYVNDDAKKYCVLHTDYSNETERLGLPKDRPDITYIGITEASKKAFEDITGIKRTILCRNPLEIEEDKPLLKLVSATRLTKIKDDGRHLKLAQALERQGIDFIWYIFTTDEYKGNPLWANRNIVYMKNRLELGAFMKDADWYVQLSSCEGDSYSLKEALYRGTPVVVCELPYFKEIGIKDNVNALFYNIDNSNADDVALRMKKPLKFNFEHIEDGYNDILDKTKSHYKEDIEKMVKVEVLYNFNDLEAGVERKHGDMFECTEDRANYLEEHKAVKIIKKVEEPKVVKMVEVVIEPEPKETIKPKKKKTSKK